MIAIVFGYLTLAWIFTILFQDFFLTFSCDREDIQTLKTVFDHISKHLAINQKYSAACPIFNSPHSVWSQCQTHSFIFDIHYNSHLGYSHLLFKLHHENKVGKLHHIRRIEYFVSYVDIFIINVSVRVESDRIKWSLHRSKCLKNLPSKKTVFIIVIYLERHLLYHKKTRRGLQYV